MSRRSWSCRSFRSWPRWTCWPPMPMPLPYAPYAKSITIMGSASMCGRIVRFVLEAFSDRCVVWQRRSTQRARDTTQHGSHLGRAPFHLDLYPGRLAGCHHGRLQRGGTLRRHLAYQQEPSRTGTRTARATHGEDVGFPAWPLRMAEHDEPSAIACLTIAPWMHRQVALALMPRIASAKGRPASLTLWMS